MRRFIPILLLTGACGGSAVGAAPVAPTSGAEALSGAQLDSLWATANAAFREGDWTETLLRVDRFALEAPRTDPRQVEAHMLRGEAHFGRGERLEAAREFRRLSDGYPSHTLAAEALLRVGDAYAELWRRPELDPSYGETARATFQELLNRYPGTSAAARAQVRLDELNDQFALKAYKAAQYYLRYKADNSAVIYLRDLLREYPRADVAPAAVLDLIRTYNRLGYVEDARETCGYLRRFHPGTAGTDDACPPEAAQGP